MLRASSPLRFWSIALAFAALTALIVLPAVHGVHAPQLRAAAAADSDAAPAFAVHAGHDALGCPVCTAIGQARSAVAAPLLSFSPAVPTSERLSFARGAPAPHRALRAPFSPRAPPTTV